MVAFGTVVLLLALLALPIANLFFIAGLGKHFDAFRRELNLYAQRLDFLRDWIQRMDVQGGSVPGEWGGGRRGSASALPPGMIPPMPGIPWPQADQNPPSNEDEDNEPPTASGSGSGSQQESDIPAPPQFPDLANYMDGPSSGVRFGLRVASDGVRRVILNAARAVVRGTAKRLSLWSCTDLPGRIC